MFGVGRGCLWFCVFLRILFCIVYNLVIFKDCEDIKLVWCRVVWKVFWLN